MKKQVNIQLEEKLINQIDEIVEDNSLFSSRTHFVEVAVNNFLETKPQRFFKNVGGGSL